MNEAILIEGYAALNDLPDTIGDVVVAGAFSRSLRAPGPLPMLLQHKSGAVVGRWVRVVEDGRGLFVRGLVESETAQGLIARGLDGLSIGFRTRNARPRTSAGRRLLEVDLVEISLVVNPMQPRARFTAPALQALAA